MLKFDTHRDIDYPELMCHCGSPDEMCCINQYFSVRETFDQRFPPKLLSSCFNLMEKIN